MFIREVKNRSGNVSIQVISKARGVYRVLKTIGCGTTRHEIDHLKLVARQEIDLLEAHPSLFVFEKDQLIEDTIALY